jgi:hypothetical protein
MHSSGAERSPPVSRAASSSTMSRRAATKAMKSGGVSSSIGGIR